MAFSSGRALAGVATTNTYSEKQTFSGEVEIDGTLNHDGTQVGLYGATPVARAAAIAAPTAPGAIYIQAEAQAMKTAVDAIRNALKNIGITL